MVGDPGLLAPRQPLLGLQAVRTEREVTGGEQGREGPRLLAQERGGRQHRGLEEGSRRVRVWVRERRSRQDMGHGQDAGPQPGAGMMGGGVAVGGSGQARGGAVWGRPSTTQKASGRLSCQALCQPSFGS